jgi:hypothetical protein
MKKIIVIFIMTLMIITAIPTLGIDDEDKEYNISFFIDMDNGQNNKFYKQEDTNTGLLEQLDQYQTTHDNDYLIGSDVMGYRLAQSFKPSLPTLTSFSLYLTSTFSIIGWHYFNYRVSLKKDSLNSADILSATIHTSDLIQGYAFWLTIYPFLPLAVTPGDTYYIVIYGLEPGTLGDADLYWFYKSGGSAYINGDGYVMDQPDPTWWPIFGGGDFCFRTYGEPGSTNDPPNTPSNPDPANNDLDIDINADLSWTGGDPDISDIVTYDIYFGTNSNPPLHKTDHTSTSYDPGTMNHNTKYYWKIVANDNHGATTTGPIWDFTTISANQPPNNPVCSYNRFNDELVVTGTDPDGDQVRYGVDWNSDLTVDQWTSLVASGTEQRIDCSGKTGTVSVITEDEHGAQSGWVAQNSKNRVINTPFIRFLYHPILYQFFQRFFKL